jgi:hypothetical protein
MHRSSIFVWKAVLSTVPGLPDCPPELSEPQWANLAFDAHCSASESMLTLYNTVMSELSLELVNGAKTVLVPVQYGYE